jgi:hypothetical protein
MQKGRKPHLVAPFETVQQGMQRGKPYTTKVSRKGRTGQQGHRQGGHAAAALSGTEGRAVRPFKASLKWNTDPPTLEAADSQDKLFVQDRTNWT